MKKLYAPWRNNYSVSSEKIKSEDADEQECVFCRQLAANEDDTYFILKRGQWNAVVLNCYPYNAGHVMIIPFAHGSQLHELQPAARAEMIELLSASMMILKAELKPDGFNSGLNIGKVAGGSIPSHLHMHLTPRWLGDTNFLVTLSDTKVISFDLPALYKKLKLPFDKLPSSLHSYDGHAGCQK